MIDSERRQYWNDYYGSRSAPILPSQFAVFMLGEYRVETAVDIGCGSGRDTFFFGSQTVRTFAFDSSASALDGCRKKAVSLGLSNVHFNELDVGEDTAAGLVAANLQRHNVTSPVLLYARFFLHAINDTEEDNLLSLAHLVLKQFGGVFGLEYRTIRDRSLQKVTPDHYRRFVDPAVFISKAAAVGFKVDYAVEGFGLAKYKTDDAYVARTVLRL